MFKREEKDRGLPTMESIRAMTEMPARVWCLAKIGLIAWALFWALGLLIRMLGTFRVLRTNREELPGDMDIATARPTYALFNVNVYGGGKKEAGQKA